jgi:hypothetical protein
MSERKKYNFELLQKYCQKNNVKLLEDYSNVKLTKNNVIKGSCIYENCQNSFEKKLFAYNSGHSKVPEVLVREDCS